jgi:transcription initiation factor TFIIIB Brf1 subunit/transcription initiation factor TFIIB
LQNEEKSVRRRLEEIENRIHNRELEHDCENRQDDRVLKYFLDQKTKYLQRLERIRMLRRVESFGEIINSEDIAESS